MCVAINELDELKILGILGYQLMIEGKPQKVPFCNHDHSKRLAREVNNRVNFGLTAQPEG